MKVEVEELEDLLGPEDVDVDFRRIPKKKKNKRRKRTQNFRDFQLGWPELHGGRVVEMGQIQKSVMVTRVVGICK